METKPKSSRIQKGVSIITCTNRAGFIKNLIRNFRRQRHKKKELIIIVNNNSIPLSAYRRAAKYIKNIKVYRMPERFSLGTCLNYAVKKCRYPFIAKFDDDDYYAPYYLTECLRTFRRTKADIIGKRTHYMYLRGSKTLILRFAQNQHRYVDVLPGATLVMKRKVFKKISFPNKNVGEDDAFCRRCKKYGFKVYSAGKFNFVAIRRKNSYKHTWIITDKELISHHKVVPKVRNFKKFISRVPRGV